MSYFKKQQERITQIYDAESDTLSFEGGSEFERGELAGFVRTMGSLLDALRTAPNKGKGLTARAFLRDYLKQHVALAPVEKSEV